MKKFFGMVVVVCSMFSFASMVYGWEAALDNSIGYLKYQEKETVNGVSIESDYKSVVTKTNFTVSDFDHKGLEGEVYLGFLATPEVTETWDVDDSRYQNNDLLIAGFDAGINLGWAFYLDADADFTNNETGTVLTPLIGYEYRFTRFRRSDLNILNVITLVGTVDEDYYLHFANIGAKIDVILSEKFNIFFKPVVGIVVASEADNSMLGRVNGNGGALVEVDAGFKYAFTENFLFGVSFNMELQRLEGGKNEAGTVVWPDNSMDIYGGKINLTYRF